MNKNKRVLISLCISLVLFLAFNIIYTSVKKKEEVSVLVLTQNVVSGEKITNDKVKLVTIDNPVIKANLLQSLPEDAYAAFSLKEGQLLTSSLLENKEKDEIKDYEYITLPIASPDDAYGYRLKKGSVINIYYTAKLSNVSAILSKLKDSVYSSNLSEAMITTKLYENVEIAGLLDSTGQENSIYTQIVIKVKKEEVSKLICLKQFGTFTLTFME